MSLIQPHVLGDSPEVLIIEDDPNTRQMLGMVLEAGGFTVRLAADCQQGLVMLREQPPALVLVDLVMPGMQGKEFCQRVRQDPTYDAVPLVILTALEGARQQVSGFEAGADDYLTKPFDVDELIVRLHSHIRRTVRERQLSPLTGLPGNMAIDQAIELRLGQSEEFAVGWLDLDNFKAYNDKYGFVAGDDVIKRTGRLVCDVVEAIADPLAFAGHIGGDDFVLVVPLGSASSAAERVVTQFEAMKGAFYSPEDVQAGHIVAYNRRGESERFPLLSITVAMVPCPAGRFGHLAEVAHVATEIKKFLKQQPGSKWLVDRRAGDGDLPPMVVTPGPTAEGVLPAAGNEPLYRQAPSLHAAVSPQPPISPNGSVAPREYTIGDMQASLAHN